eukprot:CAMPEP_0201154054 /NCGR_PEP_ID=MMETSP0851-20130426/14341_1 /ASSEMBLY_ACC=CAM_ASM_000631 /TAXON_ID=183588 /ORGANISM="Pseudo-nitzschia fraudulenta, Strain WWA7" /LENGTH=52 /DNA_ID=CAMNT_0047431359 /DNA_START=32 /DNA_END=190 /DNA_ORIENTATION=+
MRTTNPKAIDHLLLLFLPLQSATIADAPTIAADQFTAVTAVVAPPAVGACGT